jgi:hypothetical protein
MALNAYATFAVTIIPTPGNSGVAESASLIAFSVFLTTVGAWVVFAWRFVVYYIYIIIGIGITIFEVIRKFVRARIAKNREKRVMLALEKHGGTVEVETGMEDVIITELSASDLIREFESDKALESEEQDNLKETDSKAENNKENNEENNENK